MTRTEVVFAVLSLVIAYGSWRYPRSPSPASPLRRPEASVRQWSPGPRADEEADDAEQSEGQGNTRSAGARVALWRRELVEVGVAAAGTVAVGTLIKAASWGECGACDDVLDFGRYPLADVLVVLVCILAVRALIKVSTPRHHSTRDRVREGAGVCLAMLSVYGLMWLATVVWQGTIDPATARYPVKYVTWVGGYSDFDPTPRTIVLAGAIVALSRLSTWLVTATNVDQSDRN